MFVFVEINESTHSMHVITKWWGKVDVEEKKSTKGDIKPEMGQGIMPNTVMGS